MLFRVIIVDCVVVKLLIIVAFSYSVALISRIGCLFVIVSFPSLFEWLYTVVELLYFLVFVCVSFFYWCVYFVSSCACMLSPCEFVV